MIQKQTFGLLSLAVFGLVGMINQGNVAFANDSSNPPVVSTCSVPVCDVPAELERYRAMGKNDRFNNVAKLRATYRKSTDVAVLKNLGEFATKLIVLFQELQEEDYTIREARSLAGETLLSLVKFSELNAVALAGYYQQIPNENDRYAVIVFWKNKIADLEDKRSLMELVDFFDRVATISRVSGDSEYVAREAKSGEEVITARLIQLYPYFEGTYKVSVHCDTALSTAPAFCRSGLMNRLIVMDPLTGTGLQVSLANAETNTPIYTFNGVTLSGGGSTFEATGSPSGVPSQLHLVLDKQSGAISGWIKNADYIGELQITGQLLASPAAIYDLPARSPNRNAMTTETVTGNYRGDFSGHKVLLTVQTFGQGLLVASMAFDGLPNYRIRFAYARFYPKLGVLSLVGVQPGSSHLKLTLFFSNNESGTTVTGMGFSDISGATESLNLHSVTE